MRGCKKVQCKAEFSWVWVWIDEAEAKLKPGNCKLKTSRSNRKVQMNFGVSLW